MVLMSLQGWLQVTFNRLSEYLFDKEYLQWQKGMHDLNLNNFNLWAYETVLLDIIYGAYIIFECQSLPLLAK